MDAHLGRRRLRHRLTVRVALVVEGMPYRGTSGGSIVMRTLAERLREVGHDVTVVALLSVWDEQEGEERIAAAERELAAAGIGVVRLAVPDERVATSDPLERFFPHAGLGAQLQEILDTAGPDAVLGFDTGTLYALRGYRGAPVLGVPGDPRHLVWRYQVLSRPWRERLNRGWLREAVAYARTGRTLERSAIDLARSFPAVGMFGAQHARWLTEAGVPCHYLPLPVLDMAPPGLVPGAGAGGRFRLLLLGGLSTTATRLGLELACDRILPALDRELGAGGWEVRVAGSGTLPERLRARLDRPGVEIAGFVEDTAAEVMAAHVFLVPSPYPVGARTRIAEALSCGATVVAHTAAAAGIPELVDGRNALLADDGSGLAAACVRIARDDALRCRLGAAARTTYEESFAPAVACDVVVRELERLAAAGS